MQRLVAVLLALLWVSVERGHAQTEISPSDADILYLGRFDHADPQRPQFGWSGSSIVANFYGTSLAAAFDDQGDNYLYYRIDDGDPVALELEPNLANYQLASGLSDGLHRIEIGKRTEGTQGEVQFHRLLLDEGKGLAPPPARPPLKLVFFGDSNQAGYSAHCICDQGDAKYQGSYWSYPAITARMLGAEYHNISGSGITVSDSSRDWDIGDIWNRTYYGGGNGPVWNFADDAPQAVIINLGANDLYAGQTKAQIKGGWKAFISNRLRPVYPDAHIVIANSYGWAPNEPANYIAEAVDELHNSGDDNVSSVRFPWLWSQAHAVTFEHAGFANILATHLAERLELPQPTPNPLSSFAAAGQLPNGSFEQSHLPETPDGWRWFGNGASYVENASDAHDGHDYLRVAGGNSGYWHATDAIAGHNYKVTAWLRDSTANAAGKLRIEFKDQGQNTIAIFDRIEQARDTWTAVSLTAAAPAGAWQIAVSLRGATADATVEFDSLSMTDLNVAPADFNGDGRVDRRDLGLWNDGFGDSGLADANGDGITGGADFLSWQHANRASTVAGAPEPPGLALLTGAIAGFAAGARPAR